MIDAASSDNSAVIAKTYAGRDPRFGLMQGQGPDLGRARDLGVRRAGGEYVVALDPGDIVLPDGSETLVAALDQSGSDFACGSGSKAEPNRGTGRTAHLTKNSELLGDLDIRNKMVRRSFWTRHRLTFTEPGVVARAHLLASAVDVVDGFVSRPHWSHGRATLLRAFEDRGTMVRSVRDVLAEQAPGLLASYDRHVLGADLPALVDAIPQLDETEQERLLELGGGLLAGVDAEVIERLPSIDRLRAHLVGGRMLPELRQLAEPETQRQITDARVVRRGRFRPRWYARYPFLGDSARRVPLGVYDVTDELTLKSGIDEVGWVGDTLRIEGHAYITRIDLAAARGSRLRVSLRNPKLGTTVRLPAERVRRPDVTAGSSQPAVSYDWSGFRVEIAADTLRRLRRGTDWELHAEMAVRGLRRAGPVGAPEHPQHRWLPAHEMADGTRIRALAGSDGFRLRAGTNNCRVTGCRVQDGTLVLHGRADLDGGDPATIVLESRDTQHRMQVSADPAARTNDGCDFTARLPVAELASRARGWAREWGLEWALYVANGAGWAKLTPADGLGEARYPLPGGEPGEIVLTRARGGALRLVVRPPHPVVTGMTWTDGGRLVIEGDYSGGAPGPERLVLRHRRTAAAREVPIEWAGRRFTAGFDPANLPVLGTARPMPSGTWDLFAGSGAAERHVLVARDAIAGLPRARRAGAHEIAVRTHLTDALQFRVRLALGDDERGAYAQKRLQDEFYPDRRGHSVREMAVFEAYWGKQYSCSPRAIYEEIRRRGTTLECVWSSRDAQFNVVPSSRLILVGSREHYDAMARARLIVCNGTQRGWFAKRGGQIYVQCWHGTPLKRLGLDVPASPAERERLRRWLATEVPQWDLLISPNPFTTRIMRQAYEFDGEILECGYPRNDILKSPDRDRISADLRRRLGIPADKKIVLYAPTWRDDDQLGPGRHQFQLALNLDRVRRGLGDDHVILVRSHYSATDRDGFRQDESVRDVSAYPDMAELSLVADVLITDYSSSMFDFAGTGKPMLFFTYDLERYRDQRPGFYFDFAAEAPGPLLRTSDEVIAALLELDDVVKTYAARYDAFVEKFCPYHDGHAAERAVKRIVELCDQA